MAHKITGGCRCGALRYKSSAEPVLSVHCCCTDCHNFYGGMSAGVVVPRDTLEITGEVSHFEVAGDSGKPVDRGFCPTCGTHIFGWPGIAPHLASVTAGSLDNSSWFKPQMCVFTASATPWMSIPPDIPTFPGMPDRIPDS